MALEYNEYRGVRGLVFAEITKDDTDGYEAPSVRD